LTGFCRFDFDSMDGWLEEDDPIYVHPKDPYKRVDIRSSTRPIRVETDGAVIAESPWAMHLFETGLPTRYYLPRSAVKWEHLKPSDTVTRCPYKGEASYFDVHTPSGVRKDAIWWYKHPVAESLSIAGMVGMARSLRENSLSLTCRSSASITRRWTYGWLGGSWKDHRRDSLEVSSMFQVICWGQFFTPLWLGLCMVPGSARP
jgi:uncharacterized protein (DUF427 family)